MSKFKNILIVTLAAGLLVATSLAFWFHRQQTRAEQQNAGNHKIVDQAVKIITRYVDSSGRNHAQISATANELPANWYKTGTVIKGGLIDSVADALKIARKQLIEVTQIATTSQAQRLKAERAVDSLKRVVYFYKGRYIQLAYHPKAEPADSADHGNFDYKYNDSINIVKYWKRKWLPPSKHSYIDMFSNDPNTTINGVKRLSFLQPEPAFGLHVQLGASYMPGSKLLMAGPGLQIDLKRLSLLGTYYYNFDTNQFQPAIGARVDIANF